MLFREITTTFSQDYAKNTDVFIIVGKTYNFLMVDMVLHVVTTNS